MKNAKRPKTFQQAMAYFVYTHKYRPPRNLPFMPRDNYDWQRKIKAVRYDRLIKDPNYVPGARSSTRKQRGLFDG